jgi:AcrR family transcriptional regulator
MIGALVIEAPPESRRERKKRATRLALKLAALDLVAKHGFASVTVEDIADAVDVSVRTFFNYFASKEAAVVGEDPELTEAMGAELVGLPPELSPLEALRAVMFQRLRAISDDIDLSGEDHEVWSRRFAVLQSQPEVLLAYTKHLAVVEKTLTDAMVRRLGGDEQLRLYSSVVTTSTLGAMRATVMSWRGEGGTASLVELAATAFDVLAGGLALIPANWPPAASRAREDVK